jgi:hypothetical protein
MDNCETCNATQYQISLHLISLQNEPLLIKILPHLLFNKQLRKLNELKFKQNLQNERTTFTFVTH